MSRRRWPRSDLRVVVDTNVWVSGLIIRMARPGESSKPYVTTASSSSHPGPSPRSSPTCSGAHGSGAMRSSSGTSRTYSGSSHRRFQQLISTSRSAIPTTRPPWQRRSPAGRTYRNGRCRPLCRRRPPRLALGSPRHGADADRAAGAPRCPVDRARENVRGRDERERFIDGAELRLLRGVRRTAESLGIDYRCLFDEDACRPLPSSVMVGRKLAGPGARSRSARPGPC